MELVVHYNRPTVLFFLLVTGLRIVVVIGSGITERALNMVRILSRERLRNLTDGWV